MLSLDLDITQSPFLTRFASLERPSSDFFRIAGLAAIVLTISYLTLRSIYRLFFHPLRNYPGPWLAATFESYRNWYVFHGTDIANALKLHNRYGPVVRVGPNHLIYIDAAAWKDIYGHRTGGKKPNTKVKSAVTYPGHESIISAPTEENHSRQRRIFSHAFSEQALRRQEPMFRKYVDLLVSQLHANVETEPDRKFNLVDYFNFTTFDVMGDLTFSEPLGMLENSTYSPWVSKVFKAVKGNVMMYVAAQYSALDWLVRKLVMPATLKDRATHLRFSSDRVDRRIAAGASDKPDIWKLVIDEAEKGSERQLTQKEMWSNASLFMIAGTETTATLLSGLTYYLLKNPEALAKLRAELDEAFPNGENVTSDRLAQLKYLHACLEEALRVYPPVPNAMLRIAPTEGTKICGNFVPGETRLGVTQYAINHSARNFALPDEFHPERWLTATDGEGHQVPADARFAADNKQAKQSFSFGPRNCLGRNMAWFEMRLIAARMVLTFDMQLCPESEAWEHQRVFTLWEKKPLMVKLSKRRTGATASN